MAKRKRPSTPSPKPEPAAKPQAPKRPRGRPEGSGYHPTEEQKRLVVVMAAMGVPEDQMVQAVLNPQTKEPISPVTLRKHFREELDKGKVQATSKVAAALFKNATTPTEAQPGGLTTAQIFWLKCQARWQQNPERNPPPPPPPAPESNMQDAARRIAFALAAAASEKD